MGSHHGRGREPPSKSLSFIFVAINNIIMLNCHGAGATTTTRYIRELISSHNLCIFVVIETRVNSSHAHQSIFKKTKLNEILVVEATGFSGGIWLMRGKERILVEDVLCMNKS